VTVALTVTRNRYDDVSDSLESQIKELVAQGLFMEMERAPFDILFREMDAFVIHGGLGTTVEALRMHKPIAVSGILLMDQRFWGKVCCDKGVGPAPYHIDDFGEHCVSFVNTALATDSEWTRNAESLVWGDEADDGVATNVDRLLAYLEEGVLPVRTAIGNKAPDIQKTDSSSI